MIFSRSSNKAASTPVNTDNITGNGISATPSPDPEHVPDPEISQEGTEDTSEQDATNVATNTEKDVIAAMENAINEMTTSNKFANGFIKQEETEHKPESKQENEEQDKKVIKFSYWVPKPTMASWRVFGMVLVNIATAIGLCSFAILGFAFVQIGEVSESIRWWLILIGSIALAVGSEVGTLVTVVEIFRKQKSVTGRPILARVLISILATARSIRVVIDALGKIYKAPVEKSFREAIKMIENTLKGSEKGTTVWDWIGLCISVLTSLSAVALAQVSILQLTGSEAVYQWLPTIQQWSPLALALFGVLDGYVNHMEFGRYLSDFDDSVRKWYADRESARRELADIESCGTRKKRGKRNER